MPQTPTAMTADGERGADDEGQRDDDRVDAQCDLGIVGGARIAVPSLVRYTSSGIMATEIAMIAICTPVMVAPPIE